MVRTPFFTFIEPDQSNTHCMESGSSAAVQQSIENNYSAIKVYNKHLAYCKTGLRSSKCYWRCRGLNPRPSACEADTLPLSYIPIAYQINVFHANNLIKTYNEFVEFTTFNWCFFRSEKAAVHKDEPNKSVES